mgnify:CR=1 FL=1
MSLPRVLTAIVTPFNSNMKVALDELIDERLKLQEAKKLNVIANEDEVNKIIQSIAEKNKMTEIENSINKVIYIEDVNINTSKEHFIVNGKFEYKKIPELQLSKDVSIISSEVIQVKKQRTFA